MRLIWTLDELGEACAGGAAVTIGVFDGIHAGHQALIRRTLAEARARGLQSMVFTFERHPLSILAPPHAPPMLLSGERKAELIAGLGVDVCLMLDFTPEFAATPAEAFVREILLGKCGARFITCGGNFTFGAKGTGDSALLRRIAGEAGAEVEVYSPVLSGAGMVSSTRIRDSLIKGDLADAETMLTRRYGFRAEVVSGHQRGRTIGYPTANLKVAPEQLIPADGVYAATARVVGESGDVAGGEGVAGAGAGGFGPVYGGMLNIGHRPTFEGAGRAMEIHLFDFSGELVGRNLEIEFLERARDEKKFGSIDELIARLRRDEAICRKIAERVRA